MNDYAPNSHRFKEEQKAVPAERKIEKVAKGKAKTRKKSEIRKFADVFIAEDVDSVKNYVFMDVIVPAIKKALYDVVTNGADMFLFGGNGRAKSGSNGSKVSYRSFYDNKKEDRRDTRPSNRFDFEDVSFQTRGEAEAARIQMEEVIDRYGYVTVADLYDMADLTAPYTGNKYGWTSIRSAEVARTRDGDYIIKLPKAMPIE